MQFVGWRIGLLLHLKIFGTAPVTSRSNLGVIASIVELTCPFQISLILQDCQGRFTELSRSAVCVDVEEHWTNVNVAVLSLPPFRGSKTNGSDNLVLNLHKLWI